MWEVIAFGLVVTIVVAFTVWRSYKHGELRKFIEFMKVAAKANDDLFEGEIKTFVLDANGAERTVRVKTVNDALNNIFASSSPSSRLYFGPQRETGLHLEYSISSKGGDDFMRLTEKNGEKAINTLEFNLDKEGPVPAMELLISLVSRMGATPANWWDTVGTESS